MCSSILLYVSSHKADRSDIHKIILNSNINLKNMKKIVKYTFKFHKTIGVLRNVENFLFSSYTVVK